MMQWICRGKELDELLKRKKNSVEKAVVMLVKELSILQDEHKHYSLFKLLFLCHIQEMLLFL